MARVDGGMDGVRGGLGTESVGDGFSGGSASLRDGARGGDGGGVRGGGDVAERLGRSLEAVEKTRNWKTWRKAYHDGRICSADVVEGVGDEMELEAAVRSCWRCWWGA